MVIAVCSFAVDVSTTGASGRASARRGRRRSGRARRRRSPPGCSDASPDDAAARFGELVAAAASPIDDVRGTAAYRRHALSVLARADADVGLEGRDAADLHDQRRAARGRRAVGGRVAAVRAARAAALPGSKNACEQGECGSCSVYLDGVLVCSCLVAAGQAEGREVVTVEGLAGRGRAAPGAGGVPRGRRGAVRVLHAGADRRHARPAGAQRRRRRDAEIREALAGNLCRCTGYEKILDAVRLAASRA